MDMYRITIALVFCVFLSSHNYYAQSGLTKEEIISFSSEDINRLDFKSFTVDEFSETFDILVELINDESSTDNRKKGTNVLGALAKELHQKVKLKQFDLDDENIERLLKKFETQSYYISRPTPGQFLKLMKYSCQGDYIHIYDRFSKSRIFVPAISALVIYFLLLLLCVFKKTNKICSKFIKLSIIGLIFFITIVTIFKFTCEYNIKDYSFYGIRM